MLPPPFMVGSVPESAKGVASGGLLDCGKVCAGSAGIARAFAGWSNAVRRIGVQRPVFAVHPPALACVAAGAVRPGKIADESSWPLAICTAMTAHARQLAAESRIVKIGFVEVMEDKV